MRLIDLDQTILVPIVDESVGTSYELQMTVGEFFDRFFDGNVPETVAAIPLKWLWKKMKRPQVECSNPFGYVLAEWLGEQGDT